MKKCLRKGVGNVSGKKAGGLEKGVFGNPVLQITYYRQRARGGGGREFETLKKWGGGGEGKKGRGNLLGGEALNAGEARGLLPGNHSRPRVGRLEEGNLGE